MTLRNYLWLHYKALPPAVTSFTFTNNQETRMLICLCARVRECVTGDAGEPCALLLWQTK